MHEDRGPIHHHIIEDFDQERRTAIVRLKSRGLIVPLDQGGGYYKYDLTPLGKDALQKHRETVALVVDKMISQDSKNSI
jgi:hypothetical protein